MLSPAPRSLRPAVAIAFGIAFLAGSAAAFTSAPFIVHFGFASESLQPPERAKLDRLAGLLGEHPAQNIIIEGHADRAGAPEPNRLLSCRRARTVHAYLLARGIAPTRMALRAFGEARPLADTDDNVREPLNRRVEFSFVAPDVLAAAKAARGC